MAADPPAPGDVLVHGMDGRLAPGDWPPLDDREVRRVLDRYALGDPSIAVTWHSPRPFSAAAVVDHPEGRLFVKRHHRRVRTRAGLTAEHRFMAHLRRGGVPVPDVLTLASGGTALALGDWTYEVHRPPPGEDLYRRRMSWEPFTEVHHARAAGTALARLHRAAEGYPGPGRPPGVLVACWVSGAPDLMAALEGLVAARPALARALSRRPWRRDVARALLPLHPALAAVAGDLRPLWTHNDWHASNLFWRRAARAAGAAGAAGGTGSAGGAVEVSGVIDFGSCNRTTAVYDLATALERHVVGWLQGGTEGSHPVHLDQMRALVEGYQSERPLDRAETAALPALLPLVHLEQALSELEYFEAVVGSSGNADLAYGAFFVGHAAWFATPGGRSLLEELRDALAAGGPEGRATMRGGQWPRT